jgi:mono/diheme cytochrome c family protein
MSRITLALACSLLGLFSCTPADKTNTGDSGGEHIASGAELYRTYCSACHAENGTGTDQGPPLQNEVDEKSEADLVEIILQGDDEMEPVDVTQAEAEAIADFLKNELF